MSAGRRVRRSMQRARLAESLATAEQQPAVFIREIDEHHEVWTKGPVLYLVPRIRDDAPPPIKDALERRRRATLTGRCDCGGTRARHANLRGHLLHVDLLHNDNCPASDAGLHALYVEHDWHGGSAA